MKTRTCNLELGTWNSRRSRRRRGVILLLVISLLALFILLGVSFSLVALQSLNASKLDVKINQYGDDTNSEFDLVLGQLLYDTKARTVLQYHSLLRDLYGYDAETNLNPTGTGAQLRETLQGVIVNQNQQPTGVSLVNSASAGGQFYTFTFALGPFPPTTSNLFANASPLPLDLGGNPYVPTSATALSLIPNYYAGRVITFQGPGSTANHSSRIVAYNAVANGGTNYNQHQLASATFVSGDTSNYYPAYGQITIEAIESKLAGSVTPQVGDTFVINGAPFNGTGAGYDPITANLDAMLIHRNAVQAATSGGQAINAVTGMQNLGDYAALLPNYASYDANNTQLVFNALCPPSAGNFQARAANQMGYGGYDEGYDVPDYQNMYLAMVQPRTAEMQYSGTPLPIIPSFHRPELVNYWVNFIQQNILTPAGLPSSAGNPTATEAQQILSIIAYPYGYDRQRATGDDPIFAGVNINHLDRIYNIMRGCILRPMPWDHPNFTGSNPNLPTPTGSSDTLNIYSLLTNAINIPSLPQPLIVPPVALPAANRPIWDLDNDGDSIPDSIWIDPGLPIVTTPEGRRYKRLAAILVKDLDGLINVNAHGNLQQLYNYSSGGSTIYPYLAPTGLQTSMLGGGYQTLPVPTGGSYSYSVGLGTSNQTVPRGIGFGPAEVQFSNIFGGDPSAYSNMLFGRYVSQRQTFPFIMANGSLYNTQPIPDTLTLDPGTFGAVNTGFPYATYFARPGAPYSRDPLSVIKHGGVPNDYANTSALPYPNLQPSWYASPPDVWGRGAIVLDVGGQPLLSFMGQPNEMLDSPYELCLSGEENGTDSPYTVAELEVLYRYHDMDATQLSRRLLLAGYSSVANLNYLATESPGVIGASHHRRNMLTTHASHIPVPAMRAPQEVRVNSALTANLPMLGSTSILDLYRAKLIAGGVPLPNVSQQMLTIAPWEFFKGQKFDINRWLGDGLDNDGDGVVDDASENFTNERAFRGDDFDNNGVADDINGDSKFDVPNMALPRSFLNITPAHTNGFGMADGYAARQLYARHLFCLAMLLLPDNQANPAQKFQPAISYDTDANNATNARKVIVRRLAQWAINCVDFRDHDSALTPFEYDENPWNGWSVDGYIGLGPGPDGGWGIKGVDDNMNGIIDERAEAGAGDDRIDDTGNPDRGLVWGMEAPGILLTETLAVHDRGLKDTNQDNGAGKYTDQNKNPGQAAPPDPNLDQFRMPKGSLFVELYSPRPTVWTGEQNSYKPPSGSLDLAYRVPGGRPLWRLALSAVTGSAAAGDPNNPAVLAGTNPEIMSPELVLPRGTSWTVNMNPFTTTRQLSIDRFAYFFDVSGVLPPSELSASFYNANVAAGNSLSLLPGQYAVVGPRPLTYLGSQNPVGANPAPPAGSLWGGNSNQYIQLVPSPAAGTNAVVVTDTSTPQRITSRGLNPLTSADATQPLAIVCSMPGTLSWPVGMNVSEPLVTGANYYPSTTFPPSDATTVNLATTPNASPGPRATYPDFYDDPDAPTKQFKDAPIEATTSPNTSWPIVRNTMQATGTYLDCSSVLLQRLADATSPYNPMPYDANGNPDPNYNPANPVNPYITIDWSTVDLTVFTGEENATNNAYTVTDGYYDGSTPLYFRSRQRGFLANSTQLSSNPWPPISQNGNTGWATPLTTTNSSQTYFGLDLSNYSKTTTAHPALNSFTAFPYTFTIQGDNHTLGSLNSTLDFPVINGQINGAATTYYGEPFIPFPWMTWNNRPFSNPMEMLFVPSSSPGRLALEMTPDYPRLPNNTYAPPTALTSPYLASAPNATPYLMHWPFGHMLNLYQTSQIDANLDTTAMPASFTNAQTSALLAPQLYRLFDYVEVPSPYVGTERWYNPGNFTSTIGYEPPFNKLSRFRDPGRINLNTIYDDEIWDAAVSQFPGLQSSDTFTSKFVLSRQGDGGTLNQINPAWPTRFANPFRSSDSADLTPIPAQRNQAPIQATLLRANTSGATPQPLFQINTINTSAAAAQNWLVTTANSYPTRTTLPGKPGTIANAHDINRNPYFRYQPLQKLGAVAATNSNCFAVWITIGYFEIEPNITPNPSTGVPQMTFDAAHPDGYCLGQEIGIDTGEVTRHRAFFIIDRSIPVGFVPGSRLNTDDCILVRRLIE